MIRFTVTERIVRISAIGGKSLDEKARYSLMGRGARPEEQAAAVAFLASDDAGYVTGDILDVNGGWFMG